MYTNQVDPRLLLMMECICNVKQKADQEKYMSTYKLANIST